MSGPVAVQWRVYSSPETTTEYGGATLGAYYTDAATMYQTRRRAREEFLRRYGIDPVGATEVVDVPSYVGAAAFGAELVIPEDDPPMVRGYPLRRAEDIDRLELPRSYFDTPWAAFYDGLRREMERHTGRRVRMWHGLEGPITTAKLLRGEGFFLDLYDDPRRAHRLLEIVTESYVQFAREVRMRNGEPLDGGIGICDDFAGLISPQMWPEFVVPYYRRIYEAFGDGGRGHHSELLRKEHLPFLAEVGVTHYDPGQDQYLTIRDILSTVDIPFSWNLFTVRIMKEGTPELIVEEYRRAVREGAREIKIALCRGTPPENIEAFLSVAREYESAAA